MTKAGYDTLLQILRRQNKIFMAVGKRLKNGLGFIGNSGLKRKKYERYEF